MSLALVVSAEWLLVRSSFGTRSGLATRISLGISVSRGTLLHRLSCLIAKVTFSSRVN